MAFTLVPVYKENFVDRAELINELYLELQNKNSNTGYALSGKRRVGKTSIFKELYWRLAEQKQIVPVYFSIWDLLEFSIIEFCRKLSITILEAYRPYLGFKYRIKELLKTPVTMLGQILNKTQMKIAYKELEFILNLSKKTDYDLIVENTLTMPERLSKDLKCVLFVDEFPSIIDLKVNNSAIGESIIRKIRTISEKWERTALCISGSIRSTMNMAVLSAASPFYRQLIVKEIKPLDFKSTRELILKNLPNISDESVQEIYSFSDGIPFYIHFIGKMLEKRKSVNIKDVHTVEHEFLEEEGNIIFKEEFAKLSAKEKLIMLAIARGAKTPKSISDKVPEKISNINRFLNYIGQKGFIHKAHKGVYDIDDPVFAIWLRKLA